MRRNLQIFVAALLMLFVAPAFAQINEDFEPDAQGSLSVKDQLLLENWLFPDFDINPMGLPPIAGTQSMGSGPSYKPDQYSGIITPYLSFTNNEALQFKYNLSRVISSSCRRWFTVYMVDMATNVTMVDSVEMDGTTNTISYNKTIENMNGTYAVYINIKGDGCNSRMFVDDLRCSAVNANVNHPVYLIIPGSNSNQNNTNGNWYNNNTNGGGFHSDMDGISLFPNPANNNVNININVASNQSGDLEVYTIDGSKVIRQEGITLNEGSNTINLNIATLIPGNYFVSIKNSEGTFTKRFGVL